MATKNSGDKSVSVSKAFLETFEKITNDNIKGFFYDPTVFVIVKIDKNKMDLLSAFMVRPMHQKGIVYNYYFVWDNQVLMTTITCKDKSETKEEYDWYISDLKSIIRSEIKSFRLYGRKIT